MRKVGIIGALAVVAVSLSGCYALDHFLYGGPGWHGGHHHGKGYGHNKRHGGHGRHHRH